MSRGHVKNFGLGKSDSGVTANLSKHIIYSMEKQTNLLTEANLDLRQAKPEVINQDVLPIILSKNQNQQNNEIIKKIKDEMRKQKEESDKIHYQYQKLVKNKSRKSVKPMAKEYEANLKRNKELDLKIKEIDEKYQKFMNLATITKFDKAFKGAARSYEVTASLMTKTH